MRFNPRISLFEQFVGFLVSWLLVSRFLGLLVSWFRGFKVSWFLGFKVYWFLGFKVPEFTNIVFF